MKNDDLISRSERLRQIRQTEPDDYRSAMLISDAKKMIRTFIEEAPAVKAVPVEVLGEWGKLLLPYKGDPRGPVGRMGDAHLEEEALYWGVVTDADGGRWVPVYEAVLLELIEKAKANDRESLRPKGLWVGEGGREEMTDREKLIELMIEAKKADTGDAPFSEFLADFLLANGVTFAKDTDVPSKWIRVEDDKPKRRGEYFVSYVFADCEMRFYGAAFWNDDLETNGYVTGPHFSNEGVNGMKVTHWMEIQKLPAMQEVPNGTDHV